VTVAELAGPAVRTLDHAARVERAVAEEVALLATVAQTATAVWLEQLSLAAAAGAGMSAVAAGSLLPPSVPGFGPPAPRDPALPGGDW
jgi:hypothetical protein